MTTYSHQGQDGRRMLMLSETKMAVSPFAERHGHDAMAAERGRMVPKALLGALLMVLLWACVTQSALGAPFGVSPGTFQVTTSTQQAGAHPDLTVAFMMNMDDSLSPPEVAGDLKNATVDLPPGISGNVTAMPRCPARAVLTGSCPAATQVGVATVYNNIFGSPFPATNGVYSLEPRDENVAELGFKVMTDSQLMVVRIRPGDHGLRTIVPSASENAQIMGSSVTLWGVPADPSHDPQRGTGFGCFGDPTDPNNCFGGGFSANVARRPFLDNPTQCSGSPLEAKIRVESWRPSDPPSDDTASMGTITGCDKLNFDPAISVAPDTTRPGVPAGYRVAIKIPQNEDPDGLITAHLKDAVVTLPQGTALSPSFANGLAACTDDQLGLDSDAAAACPAASKIGSVALTTPALPDQLTGDIFVGQPTGATPYRIFFVMSGDGLTIKLRGTVEPDPATGQLTTKFLDNPQLPFSELDLSFKGGSRAPLTTPAACGSFTSTAAFTSWAGNQVQAQSTFDLTGDGGGCPTPRFAPAVDAGVVSPVAGSSSTFTLRVMRDDADSDLQTVKATLPAGLLAHVGDVPLCTSSQAAAGACPAESQIGHVVVGAGRGSDPFFINDGKAFLTEGYKGAPFGMLFTVPAVAGPFDLGTVNVRAALQIDPATAQVTVQSDPMPRLVQGIPLQIRDLRIAIDRDGFMVNPTSCHTSGVGVSLGSYNGETSSSTSRFQVGDCQALPFAPRLALKLTGAKENGKSGHPGLTADVTQAAGQANLRQVRVELPSSIGVDVNNLSGTCKAADAAAGHCPDSAVVGRASAVTPILAHPLAGNVYLVEGQKVDPKTGKAVATLPRLWVSLRGDVAVDLWADTDIKGRVITTFSKIPDAPISSFHLEITGGSKGILVNTKDLCQQNQTAGQGIDGQNGKLADRTLVVPAGCPFRILSRSLSAKRLTLKVGGLGAGTLRVKGACIRSATKTIASATVATIAATRTTSRRTPAGVKVTFDPAGPAKARSIAVTTPKQ